MAGLSFRLATLCAATRECGAESASSDPAECMETSRAECKRKIRSAIELTARVLLPRAYSCPLTPTALLPGAYAMSPYSYGFTPACLLHVPLLLRFYSLVLTPCPLTPTISPYSYRFTPSSLLLSPFPLLLVCAYPPYSLAFFV